MRVAGRDSKQRGSKQKADRTAAGALRVMQPIGCGGAAVQRAGAVKCNERCQEVQNYGAASCSCVC